MSLARVARSLSLSAAAIVGAVVLADEVRGKEKFRLNQEFARLGAKQKTIQRLTMPTCGSGGYPENNLLVHQCSRCTELSQASGELGS